MAASKPVVATDIRGCREEVIDGETGYLVPLKDPSSLTDRLARLISDPDQRLKFGLAGRARAASLFDERQSNLRVINAVSKIWSARTTKDISGSID